MTCESSRQDYIESVRNLCEATNAVTQLTDSFCAGLRAQSLHDNSMQVHDWRTYMDTLRRLIREQERAFLFYVHDAQQHLEPSSPSGR